MGGISSFVVGLWPILRPLARAFSIPERTRARRIDSSNSENTALIWMKAWLIGSILPSRQSTVMEPMITSRMCFSLMMLMISQSCWVLRLNRLTSQHIKVSPHSALFNSRSSACLVLASPCSRSVMISSAPAAFNSRHWRFRSCPRSSARLQRAYP